jgi:ubiquitin carboxyl-terminal hydrolase L3
MWAPIEANPAIFNTMMSKLGIQADLEFTDVWSFDQDSLSFIPQPVKALLMLFPITQKYEQLRLDQESIEQQVDPSVFFVNQTIPNACGTIALVHAISNTLNSSNIKDGILKRLIDSSITKTPMERAALLETAEFAQLHHESSSQGQSQVPDDIADVNLHFVCFVSVNGTLYELDGTDC